MIPGPTSRQRKILKNPEETLDGRIHGVHDEGLAGGRGRVTKTGRQEEIVLPAPTPRMKMRPNGEDERRHAEAHDGGDQKAASRGHSFDFTRLFPRLDSGTGRWISVFESMCRHHRVLRHFLRLEQRESKGGRQKERKIFYEKSATLSSL